MLYQMLARRSCSSYTTVTDPYPSDWSRRALIPTRRKTDHMCVGRTGVFTRTANNAVEDLQAVADQRVQLVKVASRRGFEPGRPLEQNHSLPTRA